MATIFLTTPAQVAEHSTNGKIYLNISLRINEKNESVFEVKTSTLCEDTPVMCITQVQVLPAFSGHNVDVKKKCEEVEAQIRTELEAEGYVLYQGTVSDGNSQRFAVPVAEVIVDKALKVKPKKQKKEEVS